MSATLLGAVFYLSLPEWEKLMLAAMADHASDDGQHVFPGTARLALKASAKDRHARRLLASLEEKGYIARVAYPKGGRGHAVEWAVDAARVYAEARANGWTQKTRRDGAAFGVNPAPGDLNPAQGSHKPGNENAVTSHNAKPTISNRQKAAAAAIQIEIDPGFDEFNLARARAEAEEQRRAGTRIRSIGGLAKTIAAREDFAAESRHVYDHQTCPHCDDGYTEVYSEGAGMVRSRCTRGTSTTTGRLERCQVCGWPCDIDDGCRCESTGSEWDQAVSDVLDDVERMDDST